MHACQQHYKCREEKQMYTIPSEKGAAVLVAAVLAAGAPRVRVGAVLVPAVLAAPENSEEPPASEKPAVGCVEVAVGIFNPPSPAGAAAAEEVAGGGFVNPPSVRPVGAVLLAVLIPPTIPEIHVTCINKESNLLNTCQSGIQPQNLAYLVPYSALKYVPKRKKSLSPNYIAKSPYFQTKCFADP